MPMNQTQELVKTVIGGIQEKKGRAITVADLTGIDTAPSKYFVICTGGSPQQVEAVADSVEEQARKLAGEKPAAVAGRQNAQWVAMDYGTVMVHIFLPEARDFYDLEHLWDDARLETVPDVD